METNLPPLIHLTQQLLHDQPVELPKLVDMPTTNTACKPPIVVQTPSPITPLLADNARFSLSAVKERLEQATEQAKSKTKDISKRLYQEWETATTPRDASSERVYDDPLRSSTYYDPFHHQQQQQRRVNQSVASPPTVQSKHDTTTQPLPEQMESKLRTIQDFLVHLEQQNASSVVPDRVWEAMADLEKMRLDMTK